MLSTPDASPLIHFSDELGVVLGDDKGWIWYQAGEDNPEESMLSTKCPSSLMVFAVFGVRFKFDLLLVE
jgi:hypothetical protein